MNKVTEIRIRKLMRKLEWQDRIIRYAVKQRAALEEQLAKALQDAEAEAAAKKEKAK